MSITQNCMVVNLQVGLWTGYRLDKEASRKVTADHNADGDAARVNKHLVSKDTLKPVVTASGTVRNHFYNKTLPWKDNGDRVLTRALYTRFMQDHSELATAFDTAVEHFLATDYPTARDKAEFRMGELFKETDYPRADELRSKFYINLDIDAVVEAEDFRVGLDSDHLDAVRQGMELAMDQRIARAMRDVWERLATTLGHFADKMVGDDIFRDSTVENLEELVALLPDLNILNDPGLNQVCEDITARIIGYAPKALRSDKVLRNQTAEDAAKIMADMKGFMSAFGG